MASKLGLGNMLDSVEFVRKTWDQLSLPSVFTPTMDVGELDKRIIDLKAVEQWLNVNLSMLRGTIQGLEVQRNTLAAVKALGQSLTDGVALPDSTAKGSPQLQAMQMMSPTNWWNLLQSQFNQVAGAALTGVGLAAGKAVAKQALSSGKKAARAAVPAGAPAERTPGERAPAKPRRARTKPARQP